MDASKIWMLGDFIGTNKVLFKIPVYQRNYDWSESNCNRLLDDIKSIIDSGYKHFLGTIVFMAVKDGGFSLKEYTIIDGQQRLTTMMILLKALADVSKNIDKDCYDEIQESYLHNHHCSEEFKVKLKPIKTDNSQFIALLKDNYDEIDKEGHIFLNYSICKKKLEKWVAEGVTTSNILEALSKLEIVEIVLTKGEDDPQIIFESINSTGLELSSADLIRNFLLMNAENQERLYEEYWLYIEKNLKKNTDYTNLNIFFMQYIVYKTNSPVNSDKLYENFVRLFKVSNYTQESCLKELKYYADIFKAFVGADSKYTNEIKRILNSIRQLKQTTCYPFLFHLFDDYEQKIITEDTLLKSLQLILSYLIRRIVCGVPSNSLKNFFIYLYNRVFKVSANKNKYYEAINKFMFTVTSKDIIPSDKEFEFALKTANIYCNAALCKFLLMDIENGNSKETLNIDNLTVEHIMPQTLNAEWQHISSDDHEIYLHVLGNLSVTGYNSELSNKSFEEKKKIIIENSKAVVLNSDVISKDIWDINTIKSRSERLSKILLDRYHIDKIIDNTIEFEYVVNISLSDFNSVTGKKLVSFKFDGEQYRQTKYALMLQDIVKLLDKRDPSVIERLANNKFSYTSAKDKRAHISKNPNDLRSPMEIKKGIYIENNLSAFSIMKFINSLISEYNESPDIFSINVIAEEPDDDD